MLFSFLFRPRIATSQWADHLLCKFSHRQTVHGVYCWTTHVIVFVRGLQHWDPRTGPHVHLAVKNGHLYHP